MSSFAVRADRVTLAEASSLNAIAAALLYATISACVMRSLLSNFRKETRSYIKNPAEDSSRARLLVSIAMSVSFRLIERSRRFICSPRRHIGLDNLCQTEQPRADVQTCVFGRVYVHFKTDLTVFKNEINDAALFRKSRRFGD